LFQLCPIKHLSSSIYIVVLVVKIVVKTAVERDVVKQEPCIEDFAYPLGSNWIGFIWQTPVGKNETNDTQYRPHYQAECIERI